MAKGNKDVDSKDTRVLYKKSMSTIRTHSRTYSVQTQLIPKSGIHELKQKLSQEHQYYNDGKKLKRDLSIETDICIMRNNIRSRKNKFSYQGEYSDKSKFSNFTIGDSLLVNDRFEAGNSNVRLQNTDVVSLIVDNFRALLNNWIREYLYDSSDNLQKIEAIREALVEKLEQEVIRISMTSGILNSTSQHSNLNKPRRRLRGHYTPRDVNIFNCEVTCSNYTVPFQSNRCRMPSSSIWKNISKPRLICKGSGTHLFKMKNQKNVIVSLQKSKEVLIDSSNYVMMAMSSGSFKCCAYDETKIHNDSSVSNESLEVKKGPFTQMPIIRALPGFSDCLYDIVKHKRFRKADYPRNSLVREIYGVPSPEINKPIASKTKGTNVSQGKNKPTLRKTKSVGPLEENNKPLSTKSTSVAISQERYKPIAPKIVSSKEQNKPKAPKTKCMCEKNTMTEQNICNKCNKYNCGATISQNIPSYRCNCGTRTTQNIPSTVFKTKDDSKYHQNQPLPKRDETMKEKRPCHETQLKPTVELDQIKKATYTYSTKKALNNKDAKKALVGHIQDIFSYFDTHHEHEEIRLDVHVNVLPVVRDETVELEGTCYNRTVQQVCAVKCEPLETLPEFCETESSTTKDSKSSESEKDHEIISILDGARSDVKYIMMSENNSVASENKECHHENVDTAVINNQQSMYYQIQSLKDVIQNLATTTEKIKEEMMRERRFNTLSCSTQVELGPQYITMINSLRSTQNENTSMNINNESYALWFSQQTMNRNTVPELMEQMLNAELNNYEMSLESSQPTSGRTALCKPATLEDRKPFFKKEKRNNESKGIQFSYNFSQINHCSGFKLQKVLKTPSCIPMKKPSFSFIDSESIIKVTDMTSITETSHNKQNKVGLSCPFPYLPLHVQTCEEKGIQKASTSGPNAEQNSDKVQPDEHEPGYNFPSNAIKFNDPCPSNWIQKDAPKSDQKTGSDIAKTDSIFIVLDDNQRDQKSFKLRYIKYYKMGFYCVLLCTMILVVAMTIYYISTKRKNEMKATTEKTRVLEPNHTSDLPILLSDLGF